jgi:hypothetical protein
METHNVMNLKSCLVEIIYDKTIHAEVDIEENTILYKNKSYDSLYSLLKVVSGIKSVPENYYRKLQFQFMDILVSYQDIQEVRRILKVPEKHAFAQL